MEGMTVKRVKNSEIEKLVISNHYAKGFSHGSSSFGLFYGDRIVGAILYLNPISEEVRKSVFSEEKFFKSKKKCEIFIKNNSPDCDIILKKGDKFVINEISFYYQGETVFIEPGFDFKFNIEGEDELFIRKNSEIHFTRGDRFYCGDFDIKVSMDGFASCKKEEPLYKGVIEIHRLVICRDFRLEIENRIKSTKKEINELSGDNFDKQKMIELIRELTNFKNIKKNMCSFLISNSSRELVSQMASNGRKISAIITFSDEHFGHNGRVYSNSGFDYCGGSFYSKNVYFDESGRIRHSRQCGKNIKIDEALEMGWYCERISSKKHRYIKFVHSSLSRLASPLWTPRPRPF